MSDEGRLLISARKKRRKKRREKKEKGKRKKEKRGPRTSKNVYSYKPTISPCRAT